MKKSVIIKNKESFDLLRKGVNDVKFLGEVRISVFTYFNSFSDIVCLYDTSLFYGEIESFRFGFIGSFLTC